MTNAIGVSPRSQLPGSEQIRDDRVLRLTRHVAFHIVVVLLLAFVVLFFFPSETGSLWAWPIQPDMTPLLMGAGYIAGAYFFFRVLRAQAWHTVSLGFWPISVFAACMTVATILHWDRFSHDHPIFWLWLILYAVTPVLVPFVWWRNRAYDPGRTPGMLMLPMWIRFAFGVFGVLELMAVLIVYIQPSVVIDIWPWALSPLTARVVVGWFSLTGVFGLVIALDGRWNAIRIPLQSSLIGVSLILLATWRAWADFDATNPLRWGFVTFLVVLIAAFCSLLLLMEGRKVREKP